MDNVVNFPLKSNLPVNKALDQAKNIGLDSVVAIGWTKEGNFFFTASDEFSNESVLWLLEQAKKYILNEHN